MKRFLMVLIAATMLGCAHQQQAPADPPEAEKAEAGRDIQWGELAGKAVQEASFWLMIWPVIQP